MIPVKQGNLHRPDEGIYGDCHRACVASILERPLESVPHFWADGLTAVDESWGRLHAWCTENGITYLFFGFPDDPRPYMAAWNPGLYYILVGTSKNGVGHSVVCFDDEIVHDPSLDQSGIIGPVEQADGAVWWVEVLGLGILRQSNGTK